MFYAAASIEERPLRPVVLGLAALACLAAGAARAQDAKPSANRCAAVYGALGMDQDQFGAADSLMSERYPAFATIKFDDRVSALAGKAELGVTDLKTAAQDEMSGAYAKLVDAETDGDMSVKAVLDLVRQSDACDLQWGFNPSLGG